MLTVEQKLEKFSKRVLNQATETRNELLAQIEAEKAEILEKKENAFLEDAYKYIQQNLSSIERKTNEIISKSEIALKQEAIKKRNAIFDGVFDTVLVKLKDYMLTDEYTLWLEKNINQAVEILKSSKSNDSKNDQIVIYINSSDEARKDKISSSSLKDVTVKVSDEDIIGGAKIFNTAKNIMVDSSIKSKLEEQKADFLNISGLSI